jgi:hypothetical protein
VNFVEASTGYREGIYADENYRVYKWDRPDCAVYFSSTQKGEAIYCHLASDRAGLRHLKTAIADYERFLFDQFPWCRMIIVTISRPSIMRLVDKCGFKFAGTIGTGRLYVRLKAWVQ